MRTRKIIYTVACGILLASCVKEPGEIVVGNTMQVEAQLTIDGLDVVPQSRAVQIADVDLITQGFTVAGYRTEGTFEENKASVVPNLFNADGQNVAIPKVNYTQNEKGEYKFWLVIPKSRAQEGSYLAFFAWSQSPAASGYGITEQSTEATKGYPWITVKNAPSPESQNDVVVSAAPKLDNEYLISLVNLNFKHALSKLSFKVRSSSGNTITIKSAKIKYGSNVYTQGRYQFNGSDTIGVWTSLATPATTNSEQVLNSSTLPTLQTTAVDLGQMTLIPQAAVDGFVSVVLTYAVHGKDVTKTIPLKALTLQQNKNYIYTIDITMQGVEIADPRIVGWYDDQTPRLPSVAGPMGDVLLLLDGSEAPYTHADGTRWWLDHSGYNRHCQIVETTSDKITHDVKTKLYTFTRPNGWSSTLGGYIKIPDLGTVDAATVECIASSDATTQIAGNDWRPLFMFCKNNRIVNLTGADRQLRGELNSNGMELFFIDSKASGTYNRLSTGVYVVAKHQEKAFYAFRNEKGGFPSIMRNSTLEAIGSGGITSDDAMVLNYGTLAPTWLGKISYFKVVGKTLSDVEVRTDFEALKNKFSIPATGGLFPADNGTVPRFNDNLICHLNGADKFQKDGMQNFWVDRSGHGNHAQVFGTGVTYDATNKRVQLAGGAGNFLKLVKSLGEMRSITIIFHGTSTAGKYMINVFNFSQNETAGNYPANGVHAMLGGLNESTGKAGQYAYTPASSNTFGDGQHLSTDYYWWTYYMSNQQVIISRSGVRNDEVEPADGVSPLPPLNYCYIGSAVGGQINNFAGYISGILIYNRILTQAETIEAYNALEKERTK